MHNKWKIHLLTWTVRPEFSRGTATLLNQPVATPNLSSFIHGRLGSSSTLKAIFNLPGCTNGELWRFVCVCVRVCVCSIGVGGWKGNHNRIHVSPEQFLYIYPPETESSSYRTIGNRAHSFVTLPSLLLCTCIYIHAHVQCTCITVTSSSKGHVHIPGSWIVSWL